jgi:cytochrome c oxidase subunit 2
MLSAAHPVITRSVMAGQGLAVSIDGNLNGASMKHLSRSLLGGALALMTGAALAEPAKYLFQPPVTSVARDIYSLHTAMMWVILVIFVAVFGVMFYSIWKHRKSVGHKPAHFHESTAVEIAWTIVPVIILVAMAVPATSVVLAYKDTSNPDLTIKVTGYQWKWGYDYLKGEGEGITMLSTLTTPREQIEGAAEKGENYLREVDNMLTVPVGKKVRLLTTANDVIHSFWVPEFGVKQDAIPGFVRDTWFRAEKEGIYRGQCVELCGKDHGFMPIVVNVLSAEKYSAWVASQQKGAAAAADEAAREWTKDELMARGEKKYAEVCAACHQPTGQGLAGAFPALAGSKVVAGPVADQVKLVLNGRKGVFTATSQMPAQSMLSDTDIAAVITYTRNAWSNHSAEALVQPSAVKVAR